MFFYYSVRYPTTYYYYGRRHFKLFTNCHVSWDTLCMHKDNNARDVMYSNSNLCPQCWTIY